jgi:hypothetical protein
MENTTGLNFRKSSFSANGGECVAVGQDSDGTIHVCDTKAWAKPAHTFTAGEWRAFLAGVRNGEFDLDESGRLP